MTTIKRLLPKLIVLVGMTWFVIFTLNPPRCSIDSQGSITREKPAPLYSELFHHVERALPADGSSRQYIDRTGRVWHTTSKYDPAQIDWTRYTLGAVLLVSITLTLAFLVRSPTIKP